VEDALARLRRVYSFLNMTNGAIARIKVPGPLFDEACRIAVEVGGFRMAWIGLVDEEGVRIVPAAHYGYEEGYLEKIFISSDQRDSEGRGPTGTAARTGAINICRDFATDPRMSPWREEALKRGYRSSGAFPLRIGDRTVGALTLYSSEKDFFSEEEITLFKTLSENISLAIDAMEKEKELREYREHLEDLVDERTRHLQFLNTELEAFSYSVSHDLRNPLSVIDGFSHMLLEDYGDLLDDEGRRSFEPIFNSVNRIHEIIEGLMRLAKVGKQEIQTSLVDIGQLVGLLVDEMRPAEDERHVDFIVGKLPKADCDPALMRQVFVNLLSNALKFTRERDGAVIEVLGEQHDSEVIFTVKDNGVGFDQDHEERLFAVFQRLHPKKRFEGTGVGLALVRRIIQRHGGQVRATGVPGQGATFIITLPASE